MSVRQFENHHSFCAWLRYRYGLGYDTVIHVKGEERGSKSSWALNLLKTLDPSWDLRGGLFYTWDDLGPLLVNAHRRFVAGEKWWPFFWGDEATNILDTQDWNKIENKQLKKLFRQWGYLKALTILVDPDGRLDKYIVGHRAKVRVIVEGRGRARVQLQQRDRNQEETPWYEDQFIWAFPDPAVRWPDDNAAYLSAKLQGMGFRLDETAQVIDDVRLARENKRLKQQASVQRLRGEVGIS
jgi:hypothetical protein